MAIHECPFSVACEQHLQEDFLVRAWLVLSGCVSGLSDADSTQARVCVSMKVAGAHEFLLAVLAGTAATGRETRAECELASVLLARSYA